MSILDIIIILAILMVTWIVAEVILMKIYNIPLRKERFINQQHKKRYRQFILIFISIFIVFYILFVLGYVDLFIPLAVLIWYPIVKSAIDFLMEWKYAREDRRFIVSISNIVIYIVFLILLFFTNFFGLIE